MTVPFQSTDDEGKESSATITEGTMTAKTATMENQDDMALSMNGQKALVEFANLETEQGSDSKSKPSGNRRRDSNQATRQQKEDETLYTRNGHQARRICYYHLAGECGNPRCDQGWHPEKGAIIPQYMRNGTNFTLSKRRKRLPKGERAIMFEFDVGLSR